MIANITCLISAGLVLEDDNKVMMIQGLDDETVKNLADWFAVATGGPVCLRHINIMRGADRLIRSSPDAIQWTKVGQ